jgi:hypothetical protein
MPERLTAWLTLLALALVLGLPLDQTTLFWVGVLSSWVLAQ